jgi:hypothetical protein
MTIPKNQSLNTEEPVFESRLVKQVVVPALAQAENAFSKALGRINVERLVHLAAALRKARA